MIEVTDEMVKLVYAEIDFVRHGDDGIAEGLAAALALFVKQAEGARGSGLCDCYGTDSDPTNSETGASMDHHCDCAAVITAAKLLGAYSATVHAEQCSHGTSMDEFYRRRSPAAASRTVPVWPQDHATDVTYGDPMSCDGGTPGGVFPTACGRDTVHPAHPLGRPPNSTGSNPAGGVS